MKKTFLLTISLLAASSLFAQNFEKNKYSTELDCEYPFTYQQAERLKSASKDIDLLKYKTIIRNGIKNATRNN